MLGRLIFLGALACGVNPAVSAPICILNRSNQPQILVVDDLSGQRMVRLTQVGERLCLLASLKVQKGVVGVFASEDALEGCSRLTRPGQVEVVLEFVEFDNCHWAASDRVFD